VVQRRDEFPAHANPGLFSVLTAVWNGSPLQHLRTLAESLIQQNALNDPCEWIILDNGCSNPQLVAYLKKLATFSWVKVLRKETNVGITRGLRACLEQATGRYVLPVDGDDVLYVDALRVIASTVARAGFPPLLYTDEDKAIGDRVYQPYFKPDWDPVLLLNSAYIAHLGVLERRRALDLDVYSDAATEGSPDWDAFVRFLLAGDSAVHIPEIVYSWRVHARSTADDAATKPYIQSSQQAVLQRFLDARAEGNKFEVVHNQLFGGASHWRLMRRKEEPRPIVTVKVGAAAAEAMRLRAAALEAAEKNSLILFTGDDVQIDHSDWKREVQGLFELHPDTVMIGGCVRDDQGLINDAGRIFGVAGVCGCPYRGRAVSDPGYFGQLWKQRSVSAVSTQLAVMKPEFLLELTPALPRQASILFLGAWAGAQALRQGKRVVYTPFLSGISDRNWDARIDASELRMFEERNQDIIPDRRFYSPHFSLRTPFELEGN
jgi:glycosyltransferase involved in cell wall biosynthesis